jgi:hypothetical protein
MDIALAGLSARMSCSHALPTSAGLLPTSFESVSPEDASSHDPQQQTASTIYEPHYNDDKLIVAVILCLPSGRENWEELPCVLHLRMV